MSFLHNLTNVLCHREIWDENDNAICLNGSKTEYIYWIMDNILQRQGSGGICTVKKMCIVLDSLIHHIGLKIKQ